MGSLRRIFGRLTYPYELVELAPGDVLERDDYGLRAFAVAPRRLGASATPSSRTSGPGASTSTTADALGVPSGPERGALQRGESVTLADGRVVSRRAGARRRRGRGGSSSSAATRLPRRRRRSRPRTAPTCSCTRRRSARTRPSARGRPSTRPPPKRPGSRSRRACKLLALTHLSSRYSAADVEREARAVFPETVVPRDFDVIEMPFPERGLPSSSRAAPASRARRHRSRRRGRKR